LGGATPYILVFDNGNVRYANDDTAKSRGQLLKLDEANRFASVELSFDVGTYSPALGTAQRLPNGNFHFLSGFVDGRNGELTEFDPAGTVMYRIRATTQIYRAFRMQDLYTPPE